MATILSILHYHSGCQKLPITVLGYHFCWWVQRLVSIMSTLNSYVFYIQIDLRDDPNTVKKLSENNQKPITVEEAEKLAKKIGAVNYVECSALTQECLKNVFYEAIMAAIKVMIVTTLKPL